MYVCAGLPALQKVSAAGMPFVFVTNGGGGLTEAVYGSHLKDKVLAAGQVGGSSGAPASPLCVMSCSAASACSVHAAFSCTHLAHPSRAPLACALFMQVGGSSGDLALPEAKRMCNERDPNPRT
jgi:hypothetical protein